MDPALIALIAQLEAAGTNLTLTLPGRTPIELGRRPGAAAVQFHEATDLASLARRDHLALAEAYLAGRIDVLGDWQEVMKVTEAIAPDPTRLERWRFATRMLLRSARRLRRESIAFHYDRPPEFFLPWFERWRSYSHGFYATPDTAPDEAQAQKLQHAIDRLGLKPGMEVFDMGCGWGAFLEFAALQGIHVHGITISPVQQAFVQKLIDEKQLPAQVELVDFADFRPERRFDGAVFMGTLEHFSQFGYVARFLAQNLAPDARLYADFCSARGVHQVGAFLAKHIWPGTANYVDLPKLTAALLREGFNIHELVDDTQNYAYTVRDWADALDRVHPDMEARWGREPVRAFQLFLRSSEYFLSHNKVQGYHLVAGREPARA